MTPKRLLTLYLSALSARGVLLKAWLEDDTGPQVHLVDQASSIPESSSSINLSNPYNIASETTKEITGTGTLQHMIHALDVMQSNFYELWIGTWPTAIDWTAAVMNTYISAALKSISGHHTTNETEKAKYLKVINKYFAQNTAYYFGEDAFSIRNEAYDDMLWVVLGWLESIRLIHLRNETENPWHGTQFIPAFAHRSRLFWDIASRGWDTSLCGGGMIWNPYLTPYKNSITNQLFVSASIGMYLHSPGDVIDFPFMASKSTPADSMPRRPYDPKYLKAAIEGYTWLKHSNMTNELGLYVDGFHITGFGRNGGIGTGKCDERNEMVYTYNQAVILSGLRGLWEATGDSAYLEDGYKLVRNAMAATGWSWSGVPFTPITKASGWAGLGEEGILEELCDRKGDCSQDAQTFKGIFFQHLTRFCEALPSDAVAPGKTYGASEDQREAHSSVCQVFGRWVLHNAEAAMTTRDEHGQFGMWWGQEISAGETWLALPDGATDYRNNATLLSSDPWVDLESLSASPRTPDERRFRHDRERSSPETAIKKRRGVHESPLDDRAASNKEDVNDRGRGRTVETQGGGLSVLRSALELVKSS